MQPRVRQPNAGRFRAFLREPPPPVRTGAAPAAAPALPAGGDGGGTPSLAELRRAVAQIEGRLAADARLEAPPAAVHPAAVPAVPAAPAETGPARDDRTAEADGPAAALPAAAPGRLALGVPALDGLFAGGGLPVAALTELRAAETRQAGALTGFVAALAVRLGALRRGPLLWVREARVTRESGRPAGLGLLHLGLDPARLVVVEVRDPAEALWAMEEGLACTGLSAVVGEIQGLPKALDLTASRRLALRAREGGLPLLLAGHGMPAAGSAAATRLFVLPRPSEAADDFVHGPGFPAWTVALEKNRDGRTGRADLAWIADERRFLPLAPLPVDLAAAAADGPPRPDAQGQVLAIAGRRGRR